jgi:hypothetical protein
MSYPRKEDMARFPTRAFKQLIKRGLVNKKGHKISIEEIGLGRYTELLGAIQIILLLRAFIR